MCSGPNRGKQIEAVVDGSGLWCLENGGRACACRDNRKYVAADGSDSSSGDIAACRGSVEYLRTRGGF